MFRIITLLSLFCFRIALATFGVTPGSGYLSVDTDAGLVFRVKTSNGDITSLKYNGKECQDQSKFTQIGSGLGSATVTSKTQYYVAVKGQTAIYIGTYATAEPTVGELRFIARLSWSALPKGPIPLDDVGGTAIEGSDVFSVNGQTRSKFYSSVRFINDQVHGVTGTGVGAYMVMPGNAYETSSGGPFMRDINNQKSDMNSGHMKTEDFRTGFFGPHALVFTSGTGYMRDYLGTAPSGNLDTPFFSTLGLAGYVASSGRGMVKGTVSGISSTFQATVALKNSVAQYWGKASSESYAISGVKPGAYIATLFKKELEVGTGTVTISARKAATLDMKSTGGKLGFQMGHLLGPCEHHLPGEIDQLTYVDLSLTGTLTLVDFVGRSDAPISARKPTTYIIGTSSPVSFPMAQ
ncbi:hypothetical protein FRC10_010868 [Ceratobasidium sp. 414]|nr:hypothetical protein FRC10_010868 [Ceratobasidium sp. 414]